MSAHDNSRDEVREPENNSGVNDRDYSICRALFESISDGIILLAKGQVLDCNPAAPTMFAMQREALAGQRLEDLIHPVQRFGGDPLGLICIAEKMQPNDVKHAECTYRRADGSAFHAETTLKCLENDGRILWVLMLHDVTGRLDTEQALRRSQRDFKRFFECAPVGLFRTNVDGGTFLDLNRKACDMLGYDFDSTKIQNIQVADSYEDPTQREEVLAAIRIDGELVQREFKFRRSDGSTFWGELYARLEGENNVVEGMILDISERKKMRDELLAAQNRADEANSIKSRFLSNVSHELRTPLNGIIGLAQMLGDTNMSADQRELLSLLEKAGGDMLSMVNDLLEVVTMETGFVALERKAFNVRKVLGFSLENFHVQARLKGLDSVSSFSEEVPARIMGDPARLRQAVVNLTHNAVKFTERGEVSVHVDVENSRPDHPMLRIAVGDTGVGIPENMLEQIFESFSLAEEVMTKRHGGPGLGLAISRRIISAMGGEISVRSERGRGSVFTVLVPIVLPAADNGEHDIDETAGVERPLRILVAEDEETNRFLCTYFLESIGHTVIAVENGEQAVETFLREPLDVILMDLQMPVMDGLEAARRIRESQKKTANPNIPIIAYTAFSMEESDEMLRQSGMNGLLSKPIDREALRAALARVMGWN